MQHSAFATLGPDSAWTSAEARESHRTYQVRLAALVCSGISVVASLGAFYWFCRMDKLFAIGELRPLSRSKDRLLMSGEV
jgi:hypothetical protein